MSIFQISNPLMNRVLFVTISSAINRKHVKKKKRRIKKRHFKPLSGRRLSSNKSEFPCAFIYLYHSPVYVNLRVISMFVLIKYLFIVVKQINKWCLWWIWFDIHIHKFLIKSFFYFPLAVFCLFDELCRYFCFATIYIIHIFYLFILTSFCRPKR